ncbi:ABC transporter permease [Limoniibacter endophyticus]|uniref:ABC transporter permease n=1 Tax=Limoniibacter endophyticus TaxID=1565040 RepID=A0A8J3DHK4_9HYPH|nr:ABC transporter permease [Limoniibacter endophyticus]GHC67415.1 ABC transporter permease [Limoniibacter endophyticus]
MQMDESAAMGTSAPASRSNALKAYEAGQVRRKQMVFLSQILFAAVFLSFWEWASGRIIDPFFVSSPSAVFGKLYAWTLSGELWTHLSITLYATALGFLIGAAIGFALGILFGKFAFLAEVMDPFITALYSIPKLALAPLFIIWFGIGIESKIAVSASIVFFVVFLNTYSGVREVNPLFINATKIMGASSWAVTRTVIIPSATAWVITGLKVSVPYALVGTVIGEFMSSNRGIGFIIAQATGLFDTNSVFAGIIILAFVGALINVGLKKTEAHLLRWKD